MKRKKRKSLLDSKLQGDFLFHRNCLLHAILFMLYINQTKSEKDKQNFCMIVTLENITKISLLLLRKVPRYNKNSGWRNFELILYD
jgi:hypothetical protein